ncbi:glycoside hydrolase family 125 protein [Curtobacterium sp. RRHDQ10]|uniref:glycoside hydrolase family 125 protein n=1 Tax=Curtobacterium phyllosphaerae TaxID=3413379 RepID=UPI003BEF974B
MADDHAIPDAPAFPVSVADHPVVHEAVRRLDALGDRRFGATLVRALDDTLRTTITRMPDGTAFVLTGDIPAMWLRDSTVQLAPYLALVDGDESLQALVVAVLRRQYAQIRSDPYANAFNAEPSGAAHDHADLCDDPWVWEEKYEVDSLAFPLQLAERFTRATGRTDHLDDDWAATCRTVIDLWRTEQDHAARSAYRFVRRDVPVTDTLARDGAGAPVGVTGMTWSGFRPSDDACVYGYNVPANLTAAAVLDGVARLATEVRGDDALAESASELAAELREGVERHGVVDGTLAYEVDGLGGVLRTDDANMPSLLSLPLTAGIPADDARYLATRDFVLSPANPTWYAGTAAHGVGSPHTPPDHIWPIAIAVEGLTSLDPDVRLERLRTLLDTDAGTGAMHESFHMDDPTEYTRPWFSWANAMYAELALDVVGLGTRRLWDVTAD